MLALVERNAASASLAICMCKHSACLAESFSSPSGFCGYRKHPVSPFALFGGRHRVGTPLTPSHSPSHYGEDGNNEKKRACGASRLHLLGVHLEEESSGASPFARVCATAELQNKLSCL